MLNASIDRTASRLLAGVAVVLTALLILALVPVVAAAVDGYRGDTGSYAEEGHGLVAEFLPFTEPAYRADTGAYAEEGHGLVPEFLPFTEPAYRADTGAYAEEGHGLID